MSEGSRSTLFRQDALTALSAKSIGDVNVEARTAHMVWAVVAMVLTFALFLLLVLARYTKSVQVPGVVAPINGVSEVRAPIRGVVAAMLVTPASHVNEGQPLATISAEQTTQAFGDSSSQIAVRLKEDIQRLERERANQQKIETDEQSALERAQANVASQMSSLDDVIRTYAQQLNNQTEIFNKISPLAPKGFISQFQIDQQRSNVLGAEVQMKNAQRDRLVLADKMADLEKERRQLPMQYSTKYSDLSTKIADLQTRLIENESSGSIIVRSPQEGEVSITLTRPGTSVAVGQNLLTLTGKSSAFGAVLFVPSSSVGLVKPGQDVYVHVHAFPYEKYGSVRAKVTSVSAHPLRQSDVESNFNYTTQGSVFIVNLELLSQSVSDGISSYPLRTGMDVDARVVTGHLRLIDLLLDPLRRSLKQ